MSDNGNGTGEQLAQWLKEAGSRARRGDAAPAAADSDDTFNSPASLHRYLEELAGRRVNSRTELLAFLKEVAGSLPLDHRAAELRRMVRELSLLALLALSYLQYYYWDVQLQIAALSSARVFVLAPASLEKKI
jgi:hypothetical protein